MEHLNKLLNLLIELEILEVESKLTKGDGETQTLQESKETSPVTLTKWKETLAFQGRRDSTSVFNNPPLVTNDILNPTIEGADKLTSAKSSQQQGEVSSPANFLAISHSTPEKGIAKELLVQKQITKAVIDGDAPSAKTKSDTISEENKTKTEIPSQKQGNGVSVPKKSHQISQSAPRNFAAQESVEPIIPSPSNLKEINASVQSLIDLAQSFAAKSNKLPKENQKKVNSTGAKKPVSTSLKVKSEESLADINNLNLFYLPQKINALEKKLTNNENQMYELTDLVNSLIPLITEIVKLKVNDSQESIFEAIVPVIDQIIAQRSVQDRQRMAIALAAILPAAIAQGIEAHPQSIAKAIAPEIALSIQEQIHLDRDSMSRTLGPEMGKAIKTQIELERDAMVDALYPVIGNTISKYMVEVVRAINEKVENALSLEGFKRKIRARIRGVSEAELIFQEAINYKVEAIFLIHKASGLIIREVQPDLERQLESDLVAGMLTAIRSFANECIAKSSELDEIDYGDSKIILEVAGYCYIAVVVKGEPSKKFIEKIRTTLGKIVLKHGKEIENYNGDPATVSSKVQILLEKLIEQETLLSQTESAPKKAKPPTTLLGLLTILLVLIFLPWGIFQYRRTMAMKIEQAISVALDATPALSVYRLIPQVDKGKLILTGRVPSRYLRKQAATIAAKIASKQNLELDNQIIAVNVPLAPEAIAQEVQLVTSLLNQREGVALSSNFQEDTVEIAGFLLKQQDTQSFVTAFKQIPGVNKVTLTIARQLPTLPIRIYFQSDLDHIDLREISSKIEQVKQFLAKYPQLNIRLVGYSDPTGSRSENEKLAIDRARFVQAKLISQGVSPERLQIAVGTENPPGVDPAQPLWLSRCVLFEPFIAVKQNH